MYLLVAVAQGGGLPHHLDMAGSPARRGGGRRTIWTENPDPFWAPRQRQNAWDVMIAIELMKAACGYWDERATFLIDRPAGMLGPLTRWVCGLDLPGAQAEMLARGIKPRKG